MNVRQIEVGYRSGIEALSADLMTEGYVHHVQDSWRVQTSHLPDGLASNTWNYSGGDTHVVNMTKVLECYAMIDLKGHTLTVDVIGRSRSLAMEALKQLRQDFTPAELDKNEVRVTFWVNTPRGPSGITREITVHKWADIERNYPNADEVEPLMRLPQEPEDGALIILEGPPGTGKTFAMRSMIAEMNDYLEFNFVVDPEQFLGDASYLMQSIIGEDTRWDKLEGITRKGKVFVFEDSGELLAKDAKVNVGQALSRLLNVCDGILGQGLQLYFLISTNEDVGTFHEAVTREGRLHSAVKFRDFTAKEASGWLGSTSSKRSLADLYAMKRGRKVHEKITTGFGG